MKKIFFMLVAILAAQISIAQETKIASLVTKAEYQSMDETEKRLSDYVDAVVASLHGLRVNGSKAYTKYQGSISMSTNASDKLSNNIAIGESDNTPVNNAQSCTICSIGSARTCYKRIRVLLQGGPVVITISESSGDCIVLNW
jgi:hypothetical protein